MSKIQRTNIKSLSAFDSRTHQFQFSERICSCPVKKSGKYINNNLKNSKTFLTAFTFNFCEVREKTGSDIPYGTEESLPPPGRSDGDPPGPLHHDR